MSTVSIVERCGWIDRFDASFGRRLLLALLRTAARQEGEHGRRAAAILPHIPEVGGHLQLKTKRYFRPALTLKQRFSVRLEMASFPGSIMDWVWEGGPLLIAVWVQADTQRPHERAALQRCLRSLRKEDAPVAALLALSRAPLPPEALPDPSEKLFIGSILWSDAEQELRSIKPAGEIAADDWTEVLDIVCSDGVQGA